MSLYREHWRRHLRDSSSGRGGLSAILYSLIKSVKLNRHKPYDNLLHVFDHLPYAQTRDDFQALLPFNVAPEKIAQKGEGINNHENAVW
jgi:hypothetical protein